MSERAALYTAMQDQREMEIVDDAKGIALFYKTLLGAGVPPLLAESLTQQWMLLGQVEGEIG